MSQTNHELVQHFVQAICRNNREEILSYFTEDARYHNIPLEKPRVGKEDIWKELSMIHDRATDVDWVIHHIGDNDQGCVFTERSDNYRVNGQWITFEVMGIFEIVDGKIAHWRDYFDMKKSTDQMV